MATSIMVHVFICLVTSLPDQVANPGIERASTVPDHPSGMRISGIVVAERMTQFESVEAGTDEVAAEVAELMPKEPPPAPSTGSVDPTPTVDLDTSRAADAAVATLGGRFANPLLWRGIRRVLADSAFASVVPMSVRVGRGGGSRTTPADPWAFATWTTHDADGRLWGAGPGLIYVAGIAIPICRERFDASDCGFGLPVERRGEYQLFLRAWTEIERQGHRGAIMARARQMRERREALKDTVPAI